MTDKIRVVIIEDDEILRDTYSALINCETEFIVPASYNSFEQSQKKIVYDNPDVILLDIELAGISGVEAVPLLKQLVPQCQILMLTVYQSEKSILTALANGASGYLTKDVTISKMLQSIREVVNGGGPMSNEVARLVLSTFKRSTDSPLSSRQTEILKLMAEGKNRSQIANTLFIDNETVKSHLKNIYIKLEVNSKEDAIRKALELRLI